MRIYLDNCAFNRPFDDQTQLRVRIEAEAKLGIQDGVYAGRYELVWSYILDYENSANPFDERREAIAKWRAQATVDIEESATVLRKAEELEARGLKGKDALHAACAIQGECQYLISTDDTMLNRLRGLAEILVVSPTEFVERTHRDED